MTTVEQLMRILRPNFSEPEASRETRCGTWNYETILSCACDAVTLFFVEVEGSTVNEAVQLNRL